MPRPPSNLFAQEEEKSPIVPEHASFALQELPNELISRIFLEYALACDFQASRSNVDEPRISYKARALLCSISHRMREIAIHSPQLWTYFQVPGYPYNYPSRDLLRHWVKRSGSLPIYLDCFGPYALSTGHPGKCGSTRAIIETVDLLRPYLHRWKCFKAFLEIPMGKSFARLPLETAVSLNELTVVSSCPQELNDQLLANVAKLPTLQCLTWENYNLASDEAASFGIGVACFPWRHLVIISLSVVMSPEETYHVLASSVSAEAVYLQIRRTSSSFSRTASQPLVRLPNLRFLELRTDTSIYEVLQHLDLPELKILYISARRFRCTQARIPCKEYRDFISRSSTSLEYVLLDSFDFYGEDVNNFFHNPDLVNIPVFQVWLDDEDSRNRAVSALKGIGPKRTLRVLNAYCEAYYVGWVDEKVKGFYHSSVLDRYLPSLKYMLELDKVDV